MKAMATFEKRPSVMDDDMLVGMFDAADLQHYENDDKHGYKKSVMNEFEYEETLKEYRQEGLEEGLEQGRKQGLEQGKMESRKEIAARMLKQGIPPETIAACTGLDKADIDKEK